MENEKNIISFLKDVLGAKRLHKIGNSYFSIIPADAIKRHADKIDGSYWVKIENGTKPGTLIITLVSRKDVDKKLDIAADTIKDSSG